MNLKTRTTADYDVLIIGGGIYGCGVAQAVSACGYKTALIEQHHLASGTSSQSTKLIHGGLRYLEQLNLKLVREGLSERERLLKLAPGLVTREWFHIPVYRGSRRPPWMIAAGLMLYFILSAGRSRFKWLSKKEWATVLPGLNTENLRAVLAYEDASTDDAALTRAVAASAVSFGCNIREERVVERAIYLDDHWRVWLSTDEEVTAKILVNAAGPWVNRVSRLITPSPPMMNIRLVQGSHLLLDRPSPGFIYTESLDGRVMFFRPWRGRTLAGTTETPFPYSPDSHDDPALAAPTESEISTILATYNRYFPDSPCDRSDIVLTCCGLRVLPEDEDAAFLASRETVILCDNKKQPAYLAIYGGKLTTYRKESGKVLRLIMRSIAPPEVRSTRDIPLR
ncbi:MAG: FAD-dependent oxidoreductase [Mariprofundaceae bacterium]|nr:FAD-dependent oxidoreductase [Mariprofundaceae bacterium]